MIAVKALKASAAMLKCGMLDAVVRFRNLFQSRTSFVAGCRAGAVAMCFAALALFSVTASAITAVPLNSPVLWERLEFRIDGVPATTNPFDSDKIAVDAVFVLPSGRPMSVPCFMFQDYTRRLSNGAEVLSLSGTRQWRLRFTPPEPGDYRVTIGVKLNGQTSGEPWAGTFSVPAATNTASKTVAGYARVSPGGNFFETTLGKPLPLIGACVSWHGGRGTYDYDDWFTAMGQAGENYARLWMAPWAFGIETAPGELTNYRLDRAWQLDRVVRTAETNGIVLMLCFDYHGMFETEPDYWGGNNLWPKNPYNVANGGPCADQRAFFTSAAAKQLYKKRLRYLIARYGYSTHLLAWQFFNEIDNVYRHLNPPEVAAWHSELGTWLHANDPFGHLVTTSLTGGSDRSEIWTLPAMDFSMYHSYGVAQPVAAHGSIVQSFLSRYKKPVMIGELGVDFRGWMREADPHLRGLRQGVWSGALSGSVGTSMSWWWENIHSENVYPLYRALGDFLKQTRWGDGAWQPVKFKAPGVPSATVGNLIADGARFTSDLMLDRGWGSKPVGRLGVANPELASMAPAMLNAFVHGSAHAELRIPFELNAWFDEGAKLTAHLNSVSDGAIFTVRVDGVETFRRAIPNKDGSYAVNDEYNEEIIVPLPAGKHRVEIRNAGSDWFFLDWVRLIAVLPSEMVGTFGSTGVAVGISGPGETLLYVVNPLASYPAGAKFGSPSVVRNGSIVLTNWPAGTFIARWHNPLTGAFVGSTTATTASAQLTLPLLEFNDDLVGRMIREFSLRAPTPSGSDAWKVVLNGSAGGRYTLQSSPDLRSWATETNFEATLPTNEIFVVSPEARRFFRAFQD